MAFTYKHVKRHGVLFNARIGMAFMRYDCNSRKESGPRAVPARNANVIYVRETSPINTGDPVEKISPGHTHIHTRSLLYVYGHFFYLSAQFRRHVDSRCSRLRRFA